MAVRETKVVLVMPDSHVRRLAITFIAAAASVFLIFVALPEFRWPALLALAVSVVFLGSKVANAVTRRVEVSFDGLRLSGLGHSQTLRWADVLDIETDATEPGGGVSVKTTSSWIALPAGLSLDGDPLSPTELAELLAAFRPKPEGPMS